MSEASARWRRVEALCHAALEREPATRTAFLRAACGDDVALLHEVESLIACEQTAEHFLSESVAAVAAGALDGDLSGHRLGSYDILARLGAGGMGDVYRAHDSQLNRDVAIKVLPLVFIADPDRLRRFQREARVLASLDHTHIGGIYGLERIGDIPALVLELVDGETLADRIARGPIPVTDALRIAVQIADALEAAHARGIIHRDLKPANIKVRTDGAVKVLDFGLAKAIWPSVASSSDSMNSPDFLPHATLPGIILGTAAYMSPEQAAGKPVDTRSDLWAFGVMLLEMLTGRQVFEGETVSHVLASVMKDEPDWAALPANTPPPIQRLLRRCLNKDIRRRLDSAAAARLEVEDALTASDEESTMAHRRAGLLPVALALAAGALATMSAVWVEARLAPLRTPPVTRFTITPLSTLPLGNVSVAPDGSFVVYGSGGRLVVRRLDRLDTAPIAGLTSAFNPFVSPDSQWIGYVENFTLKKVPVNGGAPITLARLPGLPIGVSWVNDTALIVATNNGAIGLLRVPIGGGEPTVLTTVDQAHGERGHWFPSMLPGGRAVLFTIAAAGPAGAQIALLDLETGQRTTLIHGGSDARYVASGHLVYASAGGLSAVRFDLSRRTVTSEPVSVIDGVMVGTSGRANAAITATGTLVYVRGKADPETLASLAWIDRQGRETPIAAPPRAYVGPRISPDGTRIAVEIRDQENDIWIWDLARQTLTRLTFDPAIDRDPVWTTDGRQVIFASSRTGAFDLYARAADGTGTDIRLTASTRSQYATAITPDGAFVIGNEVRPQTSFDIVRFALSGGAAGHGSEMLRESGLIETPFDERNGEVSPDGRFLVYESNESGRAEVYVRPYPQTADGRWQVSAGGGTRPTWARGKRELFYLDGAFHLTAVPFETTGSTFQAGAATTLTTTAYARPYAWRMYDVTPDGQRFLVIKEGAGGPENAAPTLVVVQNWAEELKRLVPAK